MANVTVFADKQMDAQTNGPQDKQMGQKLYAPDLSMQAHKKSSSEFVVSKWFELGLA